MIKKIMVSGAVARAKLLKGALAVSNAVGSTLGPSGRNVIYQEAYSAPTITNDGVSVARKIVLNDEIEDLGAQTIVEAGMKTNDRVGDGTSTTMVLAGKLVEECIKKIEESDKTGGLNENGNDAIEMARQIVEGKDIVIKKLKEQGKDLKKGDIKNIVATSLGKIYPEYIEPLTDMVERVGKDGYISIDDNWGTKYGVETVVGEGLRFLGSYASPVMVTDMQKKLSVWEDAPIFVTNHRIDNVPLINNMLQELSKNGIRKLIIISEGYEKEFTFQVATSYVKAAQQMAQGIAADFFKILAIKAPSLTTEQFEDVATFVGAKFFNKNTGDSNLNRAAVNHLGKAKKVSVDEDETNISGGGGDVTERLKMLNEQLEIEKDSAFKEQLKRRIGALASGFGFIRVGASTETERKYVKKKIEDAVYAAKAALEEGIVRGGGLALKEIAEELGKNHILYEALLAPYNKIRSNAGRDIEVPKNVVDPLKVTRLAVENACSVSAQLITSEVAIAERRRTFMDELTEKVTPSDNEDFRADENEELKYKT